MAQETDTSIANSAPPIPKSGLAAPILTGAFATAMLMWVAWFLAHIPGLDLEPARVGIAMMVALVLATGYIGFLAGPRIAGRVGFGAGAGAALLDLLVLLADLVGQPSQGRAGHLPPSIALYAPAFIIACAIVGAACAFIAVRILPKKRDAIAPPGHDPWLARFGLLTAIAFVPLVIIGGSVTSTESGMSVAGWPRSDGYLMFLYPIEYMSRPRVFFEHGHRLFGAFVGLTTLALLITTLVKEPRRWVKVLAIILFAGVVIQGIFGGLRVEEKMPYLGVVHGVIAQLLVGLATAIAVTLSAGFKLATPFTDPAARRLRIFATALTHSIIIQLILGALFRHMSAMVPEPKGVMHILYTHAAFALLILILAILTGVSLRHAAKELPGSYPTLNRTGALMLVIVALQFLLGWGAFFLVLGARSRGAPPTPDELAAADPVPIAEALVTTAHQANGAFLIALTAIAFTWARKLSPKRR